MEIGSSMSDNEFVKRGWREKREPVGVLTDDLLQGFLSLLFGIVC